MEFRQHLRLEVVEASHIRIPLDVSATREGLPVVEEEMLCLTIHCFYLNWMQVNNLEEVLETMECIKAEVGLKFNIIPFIYMVKIFDTAYL